MDRLMNLRIKDILGMITSAIDAEWIRVNALNNLGKL